MTAKGKKVLFVIAQENFRDEEFNETLNIMKSEGVSVSIASLTSSDAISMRGNKVRTNFAIKDAKLADYDAIIFLGGTGVPKYFKDSLVVDLARQAYLHGKIVAAISTAPSILANASILEGRKATAYMTEQGNLSMRGADYTGSDIEVSGTIVTAKNPQVARDFGIAIIGLLEGA